MTKFLKSTLLILFAVFLLTGIGSALTTPIGPAPSSELDLTDILDSLYGSGNYLRQLDDNDQTWFNENGSSSAEARYAGFANTLGYDRGSGFESLFTVSGSGFSVSGSGDLATGPYSFNFELNTPQPNAFSSVIAENPDNLDHMVTFLITGGASAGNYVIAFEDLLGPFTGDGTQPDGDYNDLVVEVSKVIPVPEPTTVIISSLFLVGAGFYVRRKLHKKA